MDGQRALGRAHELAVEERIHGRFSCGRLARRHGSVWCTRRRVGPMRRKRGAEANEPPRFVALAHVIQQRADEGSDTSFPADRKKNLSHLITRIAR